MSILEVKKETLQIEIFQEDPVVLVIYEAPIPKVDKIIDIIWRIGLFYKYTSDKKNSDLLLKCAVSSNEECKTNPELWDYREELLKNVMELVDDPMYYMMLMPLEEELSIHPQYDENRLIVRDHEILDMWGIILNEKDHFKIRNWLCKINPSTLLKVLQKWMDLNPMYNLKKKVLMNG